MKQRPAARSGVPPTSERAPGDATAALEHHQRIQICQGIVRSLAWQIGRKLPEGVEMDELIGEGQVGLLQAARDFDSNRGVQFPTFAYWRIRGAMLDWVRGQGWYDRADFHSGRLATLSLGRAPDAAGERIADPHAVDPCQQVSDQELHELLRAMIGRLSGRAKQVLEATILEERSLQEAGRAAGIHKGTAQRAQVRGFQELAELLREKGLGELDGDELRQRILKKNTGRRRH